MSKDTVSLNKLASLSGLDRRTLEKRLRGFQKTGDGYKLQDVLPVVTSTASTADEKRQLEIQKLAAQLDRIKLETAIRRKDVVLAAEVRRGIGRMVISAKQELLTAVDSIVAGAAMKLALTPDQCATLRTIVSDHILAVLRELKRGEWAEEKTETAQPSAE